MLVFCQLLSYLCSEPSLNIQFISNTVTISVIFSLSLFTNIVLVHLHIHSINKHQVSSA